MARPFPLHNLHQDSERLAVGAEALVSYLDSTGQEVELGIASPQEEVEAWAAARNWDLIAAPDQAEALASPAARHLAAAMLAQAAEDRRAIPDDSLRQSLAASGADPLALAARSGAPVLAAFRRNAAPAGRTGLVICDASGTLTLRKPLAGFALPRFGAACPSGHSLPRLAARQRQSRR